MKPEPVTGLVGAGGVTRSFLARMPVVLRSLGPVKAESFRVARRIANTLCAGYAVPNYGALEACSLIWIAVPEPIFDRVLGDLAAQTPLAHTTVVLCDSVRDSRSPGPLRAKRARVASLNAVPESDERTFVAEGDPDAVAELRHVLAAEKRKLIELTPSSKALYFSGVHLATHLLLPWIAGSLESLRGAGFTRTEAAHLAQGLGARTLRSYGKAGAKAWNRDEVLAACRGMEANLGAIRAADPRLAALYEKGVDLALAFFERGA
jgi:hypothetical protein